MSNTSYWTEGEYEYAFLVPQGKVDESYKGALLAVLKKFDKTLYVRSDSDSSGWREVKTTIKMPALEKTGDKTGWTLSSGKNILSDKGVLKKLGKNLKGAGCRCSFTAIKYWPGKETETNSDMNLETKDSGQPPLDETPPKTVEFKEKSGKEQKDKEKKSKKSKQAEVGQGTEAKPLRELKDWKTSKKASKKNNLTSYKVVSDAGNTEDNIKLAWQEIGSFINNNLKIYKNVRPMGYGTRKYWHSWHKSSSAKDFVGGKNGNFWLMKLNEELSKELEKKLKNFDFTIQPYGSDNSQSETPTISSNPEPASKKVNSSGNAGNETNKPSRNNTSDVKHIPPARKPPKKPDTKKQIKAESPQLRGNIHNAGEGIHPGNSRPSDSHPPEKPLDKHITDGLPNDSKQRQQAETSVDPKAEPSFGEQLKQQMNNLKPTADTENENKPRTQPQEDALVTGLRGVTTTRKKYQAENTKAGDPNHQIAKFLTSLGNCEFILGLKLEDSRENVLDAMKGVDLRDDKIDAELLNDIKDKNGLSINAWDDDEDAYGKKMIGKNKGELGWILLIKSDSDGSVPTNDELDALEAMSETINPLGITLVKLNSDGKIAGSKPPTDEEPNPKTEKTPPTSPPRNVKSDPEPSGFETLDSKNKLNKAQQIMPPEPSDTNKNDNLPKGLTQNQQYGPSLPAKAKPDLVVKPRQRPNSLPAVPKNEDKNNANENDVKDAEITNALRTVMHTKRKAVTDPNEQGDPRHRIMDVLKELGNSMYIAKLQLMKPYGEIKEQLSAEALCPDCDGHIWLAPSEDDPFDWNRYIGAPIREEIMRECAIPNDGNEPKEWFVKVCSVLEEEDPGNDFWPSAGQQEQLIEMQDNLPSKSARLVSISTPLPKLKTQVKNPPPLPPRTAKPTPKPKGFETLDSLKPKTNNQHVKTLVLVNYDNIKYSKELLLDLRTKLKKPARKYDAFDVNKANKTLSEFKNGTLIGATKLKADKNYRTVLENPVYDTYKAKAGSYPVALWNLEIPEDTTDADITKLRDDLAKCGIAIRKDWKKGKV